MWAIANALQLEAVCPTYTASRSALFFLAIRINCYFSASEQNADIAVRFIDPDFLKGSNNLAIRPRFDLVVYPFECHVFKLCGKFKRNRTIHG